MTRYLAQSRKLNYAPGKIPATIIAALRREPAPERITVARRALTIAEAKSHSRTTPDARLREFFAMFSLDAEGLYTDVAGAKLAIDYALFLHPTGADKSTKRGRDAFLPLLARTIQSPDEVRVDIKKVFHRATGKSKFHLRRYYFARRHVESKPVAGVAVFDADGENWRGVTVFHNPKAGQDEYLNREVRKGRVIYVRGDNNSAAPARKQTEESDVGGGNYARHHQRPRPAGRPRAQ